MAISGILRRGCSFLLLNGACYIGDKFVEREEARIVKPTQYGFKPLIPDRVPFRDVGKLIQLTCQEPYVPDMPCAKIGSHHLR